MTSNPSAPQMSIPVDEYIELKASQRAAEIGRAVLRWFQVHAPEEMTYPVENVIRRLNDLDGIREQVRAWHAVRRVLIDNLGVQWNLNGDSVPNAAVATIHALCEAVATQEAQCDADALGVIYRTLDQRLGVGWRTQGRTVAEACIGTLHHLCDRPTHVEPAPIGSSRYETLWFETCAVLADRLPCWSSASASDTGNLSDAIESILHSLISAVEEAPCPEDTSAKAMMERILVGKLPAWVDEQLVGPPPALRMMTDTEAAQAWRDVFNALCEHFGTDWTLNADTTTVDAAVATIHVLAESAKIPPPFPEETAIGAQVCSLLDQQWGRQWRTPGHSISSSAMLTLTNLLKERAEFSRTLRVIQSQTMGKTYGL